MESSRTGTRTVLTCMATVLLTLTTSIAAQEQKLNWAVINLKNGNGISEGEAELISDRLRVELFNTGLVNVMERDQMQEILKEQGFQQSGACTDQACLTEMGQMLGVNGMVSGSIGKLGSMFMVNLRVIDVQTGQITGVVKEDIRGGIEDVATRLGAIAGKLARGEDTATQPEETAMQEPPAQAGEPEQEEEPAEEEEAEDEDEAETAPAAVVIENETGRNRNRSGMRFSFAVLPGKPLVTIDSLYYDDDYYEMHFDKWSATTGWKADLMFFIGIGDIFAVNIGPGIAHSGHHFERYGSNMAGQTYTDTYDFRYTVLAVEPGFNFVKRWYPIKVNAGGFFALNFLFVGTDFARSYDYGMAQDSTNYDAGLGIAPGGGARGGIEFLIGDRMGISLDGLFYFARAQLQVGNGMIIDMHTGTDTSVLDITEYPDTWVGMPNFGLALGLNLYFGS